MAKKSMIAREAKRARTVAKFAAKRAQLKEVIANVNTSDEERWEAQIALQKLPRNAKPGSSAATLPIDRPSPRCVPKIRIVP